MGLNKITFNDSTVEAKNDADLYYALSGYQEAGILTGLGNSCKCSSGTSVVTIQSGTVLIYGRVLTIDQNTQVSIPVNSFDKGLVIISISTSSDTAELTVKEASGNYPTLTINNLMQGVGTYELALCAYSKNGSTVTIDNDYSIKKIDKPSLNDYVVNALKGKADLESGVLKASQIPNIPAEKLPNIPADKLPSTGLTVDIAKQLTYGYDGGPENVTAKWLVDKANEVATSKANTAKSEAISQAASDATSKANTAKSEAISQAASDATSKANQALEDAKEYTDSQLADFEETITLSIDCDHELEITGQTGHEYGKAIPDETTLVVSEIHGNNVYISKEDNLDNNISKFVPAKATILSTGKNLCSSYLTNKSLSNTGNVYNANGNYASAPIPVIPDETYSFKAYTYNFYTDSDYNGFVSQPYYNENDNQHSIQIPSNVNYIAFATKSSNNMMLVYGSSYPSSFIPYEQEEASFPELGAFDIAYPQANVIKRQTSQVVVLNGTEGWVRIQTIDASKWRFELQNQPIAIADNNAGTINVASNWIDKSANDTWGFNEGLSIQNTTYQICKPDIQDASALKTWLQSNPITLVYKLATPTLEEYKGPSGYKVWNGGLQAQITDGEHCPYKLIKKEYSISLKAQVNANATINSNQQEQIDTLPKLIYSGSKFVYNFDRIKSQEQLEELKVMIMPINGNYAFNINVYFNNELKNTQQLKGMALVLIQVQWALKNIVNISANNNVYTTQDSTGDTFKEIKIEIENVKVYEF